LYNRENYELGIKKVGEIIPMLQLFSYSVTQLFNIEKVNQFINEGLGFKLLLRFSLFKMKIKMPVNS